MQALQISLLGPLQVSAGGKTLGKFESNKVRALFAYLAVELHQPHNREVLAEMFWPETSTQAALANLRYALADLRKVIADSDADPAYLLISRERLQFNAASQSTLDIIEFQDLIQKNDIERLKQAITLYRGDFLAGFPAVESLSFEEWVLLRREQYKQEAVQALQTIIQFHEARGEYQQALPFARRQVQLEPWLEEEYQQLMRLLALDGQRGAALAQYETCRRALASELDVEPSLETIQLYEAIRDGVLDTVPLLLKREPPAPGDPPFKGLQYFDETDAGLFFGREALVAHLVERIHSREKTKGPRFLAIIGASGSGKSSLVRAGLIPALKRGGTPWRARVVTPTEDPGGTLSSMRRNDGKYRRHILLFVDQFEELFTVCRSESERKSFINELLMTAEEESGSVVIALRADFYAACAPYEALRRLLGQNQEYIGPMNTADLRRAIEEPARQNGWLFEPGLVDLLLHDIGADGDRSPEPGALPLLSHALLETWQRRNGRMLTLGGYADAGRIQEAIARTAESVFAQLSVEEQSIARQIFLRLTELGEGTQETRRRMLLSEIIPAPEAAPHPARTTETVLKMLSDARLIILTESTAEVAHEALIREWSRLHEWLAENREGLRLHRHITETAQEWETHGHDRELLYRGTRLAQALECAESHLMDPNLLEREFLEASRGVAEWELAEREEQRQRELEAARKLAEAQRQRAEGQTHAARQLRQRAYYLTGVLLVALALAVAAFLQRNTANRQVHLAAARELALASINNLNLDAELATLLALQAVAESKSANIPVPEEVQDALHRAIQNSRIHYTLTGHTGEVSAVAFSPDGKLLATGSTDKRVKLWDAATGTELLTLRGHTQAIEDIAFSPDGKYLATVSDDKSAKIWEVASGQEVRTLVGHTGVIWNISFSADGELLATAGETEARVWNVNTGQLLRILKGQHGPVAFSPMGKHLATSGEDGATRVWNAETWQEQLSLPYAANALAFSPDGKRLATAMTELKVWDLSTKDELFTETGFTAIVKGIEFSPDGSRLATGGQDGTTTLWDAQSGKRLFSLPGNAGAINDVAFSPGCVAPPDAVFKWCGKWLATADRNGTAKVWDVSPGGSRELVSLPGFSGVFSGKMRLFTVGFANPSDMELQAWEIAPDGSSDRISSTISRHPSAIIAGGLSPDGTRIATVDLNNTVRVWDAQTGKELAGFSRNRVTTVTWIAINSAGTQIATGNDNGATELWDAATGKELLRLIDHSGSITAITFSPIGTRVVTGSYEGTANVWDTATGRQLLTLPGHSLPVYAIAFSADGKRIATAGADRTVNMWDAASGKNLLTLAGHNASIIAVAFSPDGSRLVTGSHDGTAKIWDASDGPDAGKELLTLTGHDGWIDYLSFSPDGKLLATGSMQDGTVRVYLMDSADLVTLARSRLTRTFTEEECQKYLHQPACP